MTETSPDNRDAVSLEGGIAGLEGFDHYFDRELRPALQLLEAERPRALKNFYLVAGGAAVLFALGAFLVLSLQLGQPELLIFIGAGCAALVYFGYRPLRALKTRAKVAVMHHLCSYMGLDYNLRPVNVSLELHRELSLIPSHHERKLEDQIKGAVDGVDFDLFEARLVRISRDSKGRRRKRTVFRGLLAEFDFHKNFTGTTLITRDHTAFGNFFSQWGKRGERVRLEDPDFESLFEVYASDQVEARYLLTPTFMARVCTLARHVGRGNLQLAFHRGNLLLAIKKKKNSFEGGSIFSSLSDVAHVRQTIEELVLIYDIVRKLKLDMTTKV